MSRVAPPGVAAFLLLVLALVPAIMRPAAFILAIAWWSLKSFAYLFLPAVGA